MQHHPVAQMAAADAEHAGGLALVGFAVLQGPADQVPLGLGQGGEGRRSDRSPERPDLPASCIFRINGRCQVIGHVITGGNRLGFKEYQKRWPWFPRDLISSTASGCLKLPEAPAQAFAQGLSMRGSQMNQGGPEPIPCPFKSIVAEGRSGSLEGMERDPVLWPAEMGWKATCIVHF
jgi:hypothetical protein